MMVMGGACGGREGGGGGGVGIMLTSGIGSITSTSISMGGWGA